MDDKPFLVGDSVMVKSGVTDPDTGGNLSGWQGRVAAIYTDTTTQVEIHWDSITLKNMPESVIAHCEEQGLDWSTMGLQADEVARTAARDTEADVARVKILLEGQFGWLSLGGEQGKRIQHIVNSAVSHREMDVFKAWHKYLETHLQFPFQARISEPQHGPIRQGDGSKVLDVSMLDDNYGTIVTVKHKHGMYELPLCDLEVTDRSSPNHDLVDDYSVWFANR
jgi:hypothetical protein